MEQWDPNHDVYYRVLRGSDDIPIVACMQWFDEYDYDQSRFFTEKKFEHERDAEEFARKLRAESMLEISEEEGGFVKTSLKVLLHLVREKMPAQDVSTLTDLVDKIEKRWPS